MRVSTAKLVATLLAAVAAPLATPAVPAVAAGVPPKRIVLPTNVRPLHYDLSVVPDGAKATFAGAVKIDLDVRRPTKTIVLNAAQIAFKKVALSGMNPSPKVSLDTKRETATLAFPTAVAPGRHVLSIAYTGTINQHAAGLFYLDYDAAGGKKRGLFTQFENSDARRFLPCWDEPALKATFTLTATVPAGEMAVSNTPIQHTDALPGGLKRVQFATTPKMSSYLLFFGLGDFERIGRKVNGVDVGVVVKRGDTAKAQFALDAASHILPYYEDYFGVKYPLPKLDLIAGPGTSQFFGAMENWGAIFYFERDLLIDPKISTESDKRGVYITIAHEMAHQWFGDLVTMAWWDDLWLNEGFASWMEYKATDHFHPEWHVWLNSLNSKENAMRTDGRSGTHPIITPIKDVLQANEAFDVITYSKGQAVIRMLETTVREDAFRAGVRAYMKKYAYGNTVTDDLWRELDKTSSVPVTEIAHDFTLQAGVPLIRAAAAKDGIRLTQDRFAMDASGKVPTVWHVPVKVAAAAGNAKPWQGIVSRGQPQTATIAPPAVVNVGQTAYFRTLYDPKLLQGLSAQFANLAPADQMGLINDSRMLGYAGYEPLGDFLTLAKNASPEMDPSVLSALVSRLQGIDQLYYDLPGQPAYRQFVRKVLNPIFARVGWTARPGESQNAALLRENLLDALSEFDDPAVVEGARQRFAAYLKDPSILSGDVRRSVLHIVAQHADARTWDQLHALARKADSSLEKTQLYSLLGLPYDRAQAQRALALALTDEAVVTTRPLFLDSVSDRYPEMAFDFAVAHWPAIRAMLEPDSRNEFVPELASGSYEALTIPKLRAFAAKNIPAGAMSAERKAEGSIAEFAKIRTQRLPDVDRWLKTHGS